MCQSSKKKSTVQKNIKKQKKALGLFLQRKDSRQMSKPKGTKSFAPVCMDKNVKGQPFCLDSNNRWPFQVSMKNHYIYGLNKQNFDLVAMPCSQRNVSDNCCSYVFFVSKRSLVQLYRPVYCCERHWFVPLCQANMPPQCKNSTLCIQSLFSPSPGKWLVM